MAKPYCNVKLKRKDGGMMSEVWNDGSEHEVKQAAFLSLFRGTDGRPYAILSNEVKTALKKGGLNPDDYYVNVFNEDGIQSSAPRKPAARAATKRPTAADLDNLFDE